eukprot:jgi/Mesvir1/25475/Mv01739-RA.1
MDDLIESLGAAISGTGSTRARRVGRVIVAAIFLVNATIFLANVRWLLNSTTTLGAGGAPGGGEPHALVDDHEAQHDADEFLLHEQRPKPDVVVLRHPKIVSFANSKVMHHLRVLVGSIHQWHPELSISLYETGDLSDSDRSEIATWQNVAFVPMSKVARMLMDDAANIPLKPTQPLGELRLSQEVSEATDNELAEALRSSGIRHWHALVLYHAASAPGEAALLIEPWGYLSAWIDNVLMQLLRSGYFFVQNDAVGGGCMPGVQGFSGGSVWYTRVLVPYAVCALGETCPVASNLLTNEQASQLNWWGMEPVDYDGIVCVPASDAHIEVDEQSTSEPHDPDALTSDTSAGAGGAGGVASKANQWHHAPKGALPAYECHVLHRDDLEPEVRFVSDLPPRLRKGAAGDGGGDGDEVIRIAVLIPSTTAGTQLVSADSLPILNIFLPSFLGCLEKHSHRYIYTLYLGYDQGDGVYDDHGKMERVRKRVTTMVGDYPVQLKTLRFPVSKSTTFVWNGLFKVAYNDGADYFIAVHDDSEFYPAPGRYWSDVLVNSLMSNVLKRNFGVAGPLDMRNPNMVTHCFVHRSHMEIFGSLFPHHLSNQEHDEWISRVYGFKNTFLHTNVQVYNTHRFTGRARVCPLGKRIVDNAIHVGAAALKRWLTQQLGVAPGGGQGTELWVLMQGIGT